VLTAERVHVVAMAKWGTGTRALIEAMDQQRAAAKAP